MPHRGRLSSGPGNFTHVLHERPLLMPVAVMVGLLFIRYDPRRHGLVGEGIGCKARKTLLLSLLRFAPVRFCKQLICLA
jgi:hypothetical protein